MRFWIIVVTSGLLAVVLVAFGASASAVEAITTRLGLDRPLDGFLAQVLGNLVAVLAGVPLAMGLWRAEQLAAERRSEAERANEIARLIEAARVELGQIEETIGYARRSLREDAEPVDQVVPMWIELLGPRFYQLSADAGLLHRLRHAHRHLADGVRIQNRIATARAEAQERGGAYPYEDSSYEDFVTMSLRELARAERWCFIARKHL